MSIGLILSLIGGGTGLIIVLIIIAKLKRAKRDRSENKVLKKYKKKIVKTEVQKSKIREEHDKTENDIINDPGSDYGVMPVNTNRKHNHARRDTCGKDCPAYSGD